MGLEGVKDMEVVLKAVPSDIYHKNYEPKINILITATNTKRYIA